MTAHPNGNAAPFDTVMNEQDEAMWILEADPVMRSTIVAVSILDRPPDMDQLRQRLVTVAASIPRLRQRVAERPFGIGAPRWVDAGPPDLTYHLRHVRAPLPGTIDDVLRIAEPIAMSGLDPCRPLWEFTVVDGLEDGRAALIQKVHHSLADGMAAVEMAQFLYDRTREPETALRPPPRDEPTTAPAKSNGATPAFVRSAIGAARSGLHYATHPVSAASEAEAMSMSLAKLLAPAPRRLSPLFKGHGLVWRFEILDRPMAGWRAVADRTGGTINDVFLAVVAGATRRYHDQLGAEVEAVRVNVPVNIRMPGDPMGGNHFAPVRFVMPVTQHDPAVRIAELGELCRRWKSEPALPLTLRIAGAFNRLPRRLAVAVLASLFKSVDLVATNVPGFPWPVYLAGAEVQRLYAFAPPSGAAVNIAFMSHADRACIGLNIDVAAVPEPQVFVKALDAATDEVLGIVAADRIAS